MFPLSIFGYQISKTISMIVGIAVLAIFFLFIYPNSDSILGFFGFDTKTSLRETVKKQSNELSQLKQTNVDMSERIKDCVNITKVNTDAISELCDAREKANTDSITREATRKVALARIQQNVKTGIKPSTIVTTSTGTTNDVSGIPDSEADAVSKIQLASIWSAYCQINSNPNCEIETK